MKRRSFMKLLGLSAVSAPVVVETVKSGAPGRQIDDNLIHSADDKIVKISGSTNGIYDGVYNLDSQR